MHAVCAVPVWSQVVQCHASWTRVSSAAHDIQVKGREKTLGEGLQCRQDGACRWKREIIAGRPDLVNKMLASISVPQADF